MPEIFQRVALSALVMGVSIVATSCAYRPRHTPESVQPPESLVAAMERVDAGRLFADDSLTTMTLTRDGAILTALARNRSLAVERYNPAISRSLIPQARAAWDPTLLGTVSYGFSNNQLGGSRFSSSSAATSNKSYAVDSSVRLENSLPTGTELFLSGGFSRRRDSFSLTEYSGSWSAGVTQSLLRGAGLDVNLVGIRQATNDSAITEHQLRDFVIELVRQVEIAYWNLVLARDALEIRRFSVDLADEQFRLNEIYLEVGKGVIGDVLSAKAAAAQRRAELIDAEANFRQRTIDLARLLSPESDRQFLVTFEPSDDATVVRIAFDPEASATLASLYRPDLAEARLRLANSDLEVVRTRNGLLPRLDLFASYGRTSLGNNYGDAVDHLDEPEFNNYEVGLDLEIQPLNRAARARDRQVRFERAQAEAAVFNLEQVIDADIYRAVVEVERQWQRIEATQSTVEAREEEFRAARAEFDVGKATTLDVLQIQENLIQARLDEVTARVAYIEALTELYAREATLLDRRGVLTSEAGKLDP